MSEIVQVDVTLLGRQFTIGTPLEERDTLEQAVRLLSTTSLTAGEIASACGFYDQSSFTRQFRSVLGLTPGAYRRSGSGEDGSGVPG